MFHSFDHHAGWRCLETTPMFHAISTGYAHCRNITQVPNHFKINERQQTRQHSTKNNQISKNWFNVHFSTVARTLYTVYIVYDNIFCICQQLGLFDLQSVNKFPKQKLAENQYFILLKKKTRNNNNKITKPLAQTHRKPTAATTIKFQTMSSARRTTQTKEIAMEWNEVSQFV